MINVIKYFSFILIINLVFNRVILAQQDSSSFIIIDTISNNICKVDLNDTVIRCIPPEGGPYSIGSQYYLDIDYNGAFDFKILISESASASTGSHSIYNTLSSFDSSYFGINSLTMDIISELTIPFPVTDTVYRSMVYKYELNDTIYSNDIFVNNATYIANYYSTNTPYGTQYGASLDNWFGGTHYIGIKKIKNGYTHLGWIKMKVYYYNYVQLFEYAMECSLVNNHFEEDIFLVNVYPNPVTDFLFINLNTNNNVKSIQLIDIQGKQISEINNLSSKNKIDLSNSPKGFYFLKINTNNIPYWIKVIKS